MRKINWAEVTPSSSTLLPAGAYVIEIMDVIDNEKDENLSIIYDVVEGDHAGIFKDITKDDENWKHQIKQTYSKNGQGLFARFLHALEDENPGFTVEAWNVNQNVLDFVHKRLGVVLKEFRYVSSKDGAPRWRLTLDRTVPIETVRNGSPKLADPDYSPDTNEADWLALREAFNMGASIDNSSRATHPADADLPF